METVRTRIQGCTRAYSKCTHAYTNPYARVHKPVRTRTRKWKPQNGNRNHEMEIETVKNGNGNCTRAYSKCTHAYSRLYACVHKPVRTRTRKWKPRNGNRNYEMEIETVKMEMETVRARIQSVRTRTRECTHAYTNLYARVAGAVAALVSNFNINFL